MTIQAFKLGSLGQDSVTGVKSATVWINGADRCMSFVNPAININSSSGTAYQVTAGTTLYITELTLTHYPGAGAAAYIRIGYGDTTVADGTLTPTNMVVITGMYHLFNTEPVSRNLPVLIQIPAEKYPCAITSTAAISCSFYGIEVA